MSPTCGKSPKDTSHVAQSFQSAPCNRYTVLDMAGWRVNVALTGSSWLSLKIGICVFMRLINIWVSFHNYKLGIQRVQCMYAEVFGFNFLRDGKPPGRNSSVKRRRVWCGQRVQRLDGGCLDFTRHGMPPGLINSSTGLA
jgi:hypothetical protein